MTPDCRAWTERMIAQWSARAEALQEDPAASAAQLLRAACLEDVVRDLRARIQPYLHPEYRVWFNRGPIMDSVRWQIEDSFGLPRSPATGEANERPKWIDAPVVPPADDPEPFTAGEQLGMFG